MKKIFVLTGEPSGDKLASTLISRLKLENSEIEYLSVGGTHLKKLGIKSIYDLKEITYLGFTSVLLNIFRIKSKINKTVEEIVKFNPDILLSVDSPDFTLRVAEKVKKINKFEKKYFDKENINNTFVGHPLIERNQNNKTIIDNILPKNKKIISIFPGSRNSETNVLLPILLDFIKLMNKKHNEYFFYIHATEENKSLILEHVKKYNFDNIDIVSEENIKSEILSKSIFAVSKSGTVSLQICNFNVPSIIIYKLSFINFMIFKMLVNVKFANIINIINNREVIPELLQKECNADEIYRSVIYLLKNPELIKKQVSECSKTLEGIRSKTSSAGEASSILIKYLS